MGYRKSLKNTIFGFQKKSSCCTKSHYSKVDFAMQNFQVFLALILQEIPIVLNILEFKKKRKKESHFTNSRCLENVFICIKAETACVGTWE